MLWCNGLSYLLRHLHPMSASFSSGALLQLQFPAKVPGKTTEDNPSTWAAATLVGDPDGDPAIAVIVIWGVNQWIVDLPLFCLSYCLHFK